MKEASHQTNWYTTSNMKFDQTLQRLEPLHDRMHALESYTQRGLPLLTHLQISDALQEFLCLPDQLKLVDYDNKKLEEFAQALLNPEQIIKAGNTAMFISSDRKSDSEDEIGEYPSTVHMTEQ